jgi:hypothetical protein
VSEQREEVVIPKPIEVLDNVNDDLDRIELVTAALSCFQHPAPEYSPGHLYGKTGDNASQVLPSSQTLSPEQKQSLGDVVRKTIENQPYTAIAIALGVGWLLGRMNRSF